MRRLLLFCFFSGIFGISLFGQYVSIEGRQFKDENGNDFYPVVCNYPVQYIYKDQDTATLCMTPDASCDAWCYDCSELTPCLNQMYNNFIKLKQMGFNTIRLMGANPIFWNIPDQPKGWKIRAYDYTYAINSSCDTSSLRRYHDYYIIPPYTSNPTAQHLWTLFDSVLIQAGKAELKVIILGGGGNGDYPIEFPEEYANYLESLAQHISLLSPQFAKVALMAYDLENEPLYTWKANTLWPSDTIGHSKQDICNNVKSWYNAIKEYDTNHLVTFNGSSFSDVFEYDPTILSIDFYSPHFYPKKSSYDPSPFANILDRIHGHYFWLRNTLPMPFLVGETGFRSQAGMNGPDGSNEQQSQYAAYTLDLARFYEGSGYSWWNYQDYYWSEDDCYYGLLFRDPITHIVTEKPIVNEFRQYNPNNSPPAFTPPNNYNDPFNHAYFNPNHNYLSGHVQDEDGNPIQDALIQGWTAISTNGQGEIVYDPHYTFTDSNGDFTIIPYDYDINTDPNYEVIVQIKVSASGCSRFITGWYSNSTGVPPQSVDTIILKRIDFSYEKHISNISCSDPVLYQAWDNLTFTNVYIEPDVNFEAKARREISLFDEFHAFNEAWIHTTETFIPCESLSSGFLKSETIPENQGIHEQQITNSIQLNFVTLTDIFDFTIYPNPGYGHFTIEMTSTNLTDLNLLISDQYGRILLNKKMDITIFEVDLSYLPKGVYHILVSDHKNMKMKKAIII